MPRNVSPPIANATLVDDACAREAIHIPGSIQPHGVLLTVNPINLTVLQVAGDVQGMLNLNPQELLGQSLKAQLGSAALERLNVLLAKSEITPRPFLVFQVAAASAHLDVCAHMSEGLLVLEIERHSSTSANALELSQEMAGAIGNVQTVAQLTQRMADEVQHYTAFDRVMIYQFDAEGNGVVAAERRSNDSVESFLGLHYPAGDIPQQARDMYKKNWIRCIPNVGYLPAPIFPPNNPLTGLPNNLTFSLLRSVSPVHLEYLSNMGVAASMSLSIVVNGELWGLIACHHHEPHFLNCDLRGALELFAQLSSLQLTTLLEIDRKRRAAFRRDIHDDLLTAMVNEGFAEGLRNNCALLTQLTSAAGVVVHINNETSRWGQVPSDDSIKSIIALLNNSSQRRVWSTDALMQYLPQTGSDPLPAAGVLSISISRTPCDYVLWFLPEQVTTVLWAGNPHKPEELHLRMTPRKSFAAWREQRAGRSRAWEDDEIEAATRLRVMMLEFALVHSDEIARERDALSKQQQMLMAELDHRVKNILATIQAVVRFSSKSAASMVDFTHTLERRLLSMARAHDLLTTSRWVGASLHRLIKDELGPFCPEGDSKLQLIGDDVLLVPSSALSISLVLHELTTNAIKYGSLSVQGGSISVTSQIVTESAGPELVLKWVELGGPRVTKPKRSGFGRLLLEQVFNHDPHGGNVDLKFESDGLQCTLRLPLDRLSQSPMTPEALTNESAKSASAKTRLEGVRVLIVEDNDALSRELAEILREAGAEVVGPFNAIEDSMSVASSHPFDVALLDVNLNGIEVWPLAATVRKRNIPILFTIGLSDIALPPAEFHDVTTVRKPYDSGRLISKLRRTINANESS